MYRYFSGLDDAEPDLAEEAEQSSLSEFCYVDVHESGIVAVRSEEPGAGSRMESTWTDRFQEIVSREDSFEKFRDLENFALEFYMVAEIYSKIIISENFLPSSLKTIQAKSLGGVAGGSKFICRGILFKFYRDVQLSFANDNGPMWLYGGKTRCDEKAMKSARNELKGLLMYYQCDMEGVNFPLMSVIHYRGFCLMAMSLLPITAETLIYGSADAGSSVQASDPEFNTKMERLGRMLNLAPHHVCNSQHVMSGPGDIEGHLGKNGKYYLLDFGRVLPPECPSMLSQPHHSIFYNLLRPSFVGNYRRVNPDNPLCSDAFSNWLAPSERKAENSKIRDATLYLHSHVIPDFARQLLSDDYLHVNEENVVSEMHKVGINARHLGVLRTKVLEIGQRKRRARTMAKILMTEAAARTCKQLLRKQLRAQGENSALSTPHVIVSKFLDKLFNYDSSRKRAMNPSANAISNNLSDQSAPQSNEGKLSIEEENRLFWAKEIKPKLQKRFPTLLSKPCLANDSESLRPLVNECALFQRINAMSGIVVDQRIEKLLRAKEHEDRKKEEPEQQMDFEGTEVKSSSSSPKGSPPSNNMKDSRKKEGGDQQQQDEVKSSKKRRHDGPIKLYIFPSDILEINPVVSHLHIINFARAARIYHDMKLNEAFREQATIMSELMNAINIMEKAELNATTMHIPSRFYWASSYMLYCDHFLAYHSDHLQPSRLGEVEQHYYKAYEIFASMTERFTRKHESKAAVKMIAAEDLSHKKYRYNSLVCAVLALCGHFVALRAIDTKKESRKRFNSSGGNVSSNTTSKSHANLDAHYEKLLAVAERNLAILQVDEMSLLIESILNSLNRHCMRAQTLNGFMPELEKYTEEAKFDPNDPYASMILRLFSTFASQKQSGDVAFVREMTTFFLHLLLSTFYRKNVEEDGQFASLKRHMSGALPSQYYYRKRLDLEKEELQQPVPTEPNRPKQDSSEKEKRSSKRKKKRSSIHSEEANIQPLVDSMKKSNDDKKELKEKKKQAKKAAREEKKKNKGKKGVLNLGHLGSTSERKKIAHRPSLSCEDFQCNSDGNSFEFEGSYQTSVSDFRYSPNASIAENHILRSVRDRDSPACSVSERETSDEATQPALQLKLSNLLVESPATKVPESPRLEGSKLSSELLVHKGWHIQRRVSICEMKRKGF